MPLYRQDAKKQTLGGSLSPQHRSMPGCTRGHLPLLQIERDVTLPPKLLHRLARSSGIASTIAALMQPWP